LFKKKWAGEPLTCGPNSLLNFQVFSKPLQMTEFKNRKRDFQALKNYEKFWDDIFDQGEQLFLLVKLPNRNRF
jgi:hypothetical protein